jgi:P-type Ca2+ transporter type 2C
MAAPPEELKIHEKDIDDVIAEMQTDKVKGLTAAEAAKRLLEDGPNELEKPPRVSLLVLFLIQLNSVIMYLLMGAVVASAAIKATGDDKDQFLSYIDSIAITIIVFINASIAAKAENNANDALEALSSLQAPISTLIRDGEEIRVESSDIVRGDLVKLGTGDVVPADVRCITANDLRVNEMLLTGEPEDVAKSTKVKPRVPGHPEKLTADNMAFSSCNVKAGACLGLVVATGMRTRVGTIAALLNATGDDDKGPEPTEEEIASGAAPKPKKKKEPCLPDTKSGQSPLQENLEKLAVKLGYMAIAVCTVVFIVGVSLNTKDPEDQDTPSWLFMILVAVTLTVAAIPEGLPLCVTIALTSGCAEMVKENVLVRKIAAVETLGSASIICTDKTGTLTEGKMTLVAMHAGGVDYTVTGKGFDPTVGKITTSNGTDASNDAPIQATLGSAVLCSNTSLKLETDVETGTSKWTPRGNSSEAPLVVAGQKVGIKLEDLEDALERTAEIPFSSSRKMMVTVTKTVKQTPLAHVAKIGEQTAHVKGAPNYIMEKCTKYITADGSVKPLDDAVKKKIMSTVDDLSEQALRVLAVATKNVGGKLPFDTEQDTDVKFAKLVNDLTFCGLCASIDPERDGVKDAVRTSKVAGVRVVMITGDYLKTAIAIAKNIGILNAKTFTEDNGEATDCKALRPEKDTEYASSDKIDALTRTTSVFARAKPEDKLEIVKSLQRQGWVCAMTGDGVNDAPALQRADIGVAMGLEGTEVAKGASDMILTDDNFCSIVKAIEKGRIIYAGIQKFVAFIMSVHFAEVVQIFLCIVSSIPVMRQPLQILFLILVTDLPPSIALGFEPGEDLTMKRSPRPKTQPVVQMWMWRGIVINGMILTVCIFCTYLIALHAYAGAFLTDDITDTSRSSCSIWPSTGAMTPSLKLDCTTDDCKRCITTSIRRARTTAFIALVYAENFRAYCSRSFENGVWVKPFSNMTMNKAIIFAQLALYFALFCPGLNESVLGLYVYEIHGFGWFLAVMGSLACLVGCEIYKKIAGQFIKYEELADFKDPEDEAGPDAVKIDVQ